jgi:hypothetical protein
MEKRSLKFHLEAQLERPLQSAAQTFFLVLRVGFSLPSIIFRKKFDGKPAETRKNQDIARVQPWLATLFSLGLVAVPWRLSTKQMGASAGDIPCVAVSTHHR